LVEISIDPVTHSNSWIVFAVIGSAWVGSVETIVESGVAAVFMQVKALIISSAFMH
jgi:hypothetical protein